MRFEAGRNLDIRFMAHLWEPLRWIHSPLAVYLAAEGLWMASSLLLRALGFRPFKHPSVSRPRSPVSGCAALNALTVQLRACAWPLVFC